MHYELYVDSLFVMNFGMNLYLLMLVNGSTLRTACGWRLVAGAALGSVCCLLFLCSPFPAAVRLAAGILTGTVGMLLAAFPVGSFKMLLKLLERTTLYAFGMGGALLFLIRLFPGIRGFLTGMWGILAVGGVVYLGLRRFVPGMKEREFLCRATLRRAGASMTVVALVDSGNSLIEPVSGKPVSIVEEKVFRGLWKNSMQGFRVIPFHSIGRQHGLLDGYLLPELCLDIDGVRREFRDVYIAVSRDGIGISESAAEESVKMIVNPMLLSEGRKGRPAGRQKVRKHDSENSNTGENAV